MPLDFSKPAGNPANHGYLCGIILKELAAGRTCDVFGGVTAVIKTRADYEDRKYRLIGKFGEVMSRKDGVVGIATRAPPEWAERMIHEKIWDCEEMVRWFIPEGER